MNVVSGISMAQADGSWRKLQISLDYRDLLMLVREGRLGGLVRVVVGEDGAERIIDETEGQPLPLDACVRALQRRADALLITQMAREHLVTRVEAQRQIAAL